MIGEKAARAKQANDLLAVIAAHGRRFFYSQKYDRISHFEIGPRGHVLLIDKWSGKPVFTHYSGQWRHFTDGGTLRRLIEDLRDFIRTGKPISRRHFGPWPSFVCDGDLWGYGGDMDAVRAGVMLTGAVAVATPASQAVGGE